VSRDSNMVEKSRWSPDTNLPELSQFLCKSIEKLDFETTTKLKNIEEVTLFHTFKIEDKFKMAASTTVIYFVLNLSQFFTLFKK
jgi:hypothetical protein